MKDTRGLKCHFCPSSGIRIGSSSHLPLTLQLKKAAILCLLLTRSQCFSFVTQLRYAPRANTRQSARRPFHCWVPSRAPVIFDFWGTLSGANKTKSSWVWAPRYPEQFSFFSLSFLILALRVETVEEVL